jgi:hypothetical protein
MHRKHKVIFLMKLGALRDSVVKGAFLQAMYFRIGVDSRG